jgi:hypothetical protein
MELVTILFAYPQAILQFLEIGILDSVDCGKGHMICEYYRNDRTAQSGNLNTSKLLLSGGWLD